MSLFSTFKKPSQSQNQPSQRILKPEHEKKKHEQNLFSFLLPICEHYDVKIVLWTFFDDFCHFLAILKTFTEPSQNFHKTIKLEQKPEQRP
jgi:hypothetical protein